MNQPGNVSPTDETASPLPVSSSDRFRRNVLLVLVLMWMAVLLGFVVFTANPPQVNFKQLALSDVVVVAELKDPQRGEFTVQSSIKGDLSAGTELAIENWSIALLNRNLQTKQWVLPLERSGKTWRVTELWTYPESGTNGSATLFLRSIYPLTAQVRSQLSLATRPENSQGLRQLPEN